MTNEKPTDVDFKNGVEIFRGIMIQYLTTMNVNEKMMKEINEIFLNKDLGIENKKLEKEIEHIRSTTIDRYKRMCERIMCVRLDFNKDSYERIKEKVEELAKSYFIKEDKNQTNIKDF